MLYQLECILFYILGLYVIIKVGFQLSKFGFPIFISTSFVIVYNNSAFIWIKPYIVISIKDILYFCLYKRNTSRKFEPAC